MNKGFPTATTAEVPPGYSQPAGHPDVADVPRWRAKLPKHWERFPFYPTLYLFGAVAAAFASLPVLYVASDQPTDDFPWKTAAPSVYLSILALVSTTLAQWAFQSGAETFWWDQLHRAAKLRDLHYTWKFSHEVLPLFGWHRPWNLVRSAGLSVVVLGAVGPLLQQAVSTELVTKTSQQPATLPIRTEPMWNLTVLNNNLLGGFGWSIPMYQPEFASIALDHTQRHAPLLTGGGFCRGTCTANITVAGFARNCTERLTSPDGLPYLKPAKPVVQNDRDLGFYYTHACTTLVSSNASRVSTGNSSDPYCGLLQTYYQLSVDNVKMKNPTDLPTLSYTSYVRPVGVDDSLLVQQCNFSTAFLTMTISLANDSSVALSSQYGLPQDRVVEPIRSPTNDTAVMAVGLLAGFLQVMRDSYEGYVLWDLNEGTNIMLGTGPRLYGDTANLTQTVVIQPGTNASLLAVPFRSPLADFTNTLNEMALRYALTAVPDNDAARVKANEAYFAPLYGSRAWDVRATSIPKTKLSKTQSVVLEESRTVAVFRVSYAYAVGASCVVLLCALATAPLLSGWRRPGRDLSVSPLEVANAFDAPLLAGVPSGASVGTMLRAVGGVEVRYGEPRANGYGDVGLDEYMVQESTEGDEHKGFVIGRATEVAPPQTGVQYTG